MLCGVGVVAVTPEQGRECHAAFNVARLSLVQLFDHFLVQNKADSFLFHLLKF